MVVLSYVTYIIIICHKMWKISLPWQHRLGASLNNTAKLADPETSVRYKNLQTYVQSIRVQNSEDRDVDWSVTLNNASDSRANGQLSDYIGRTNGLGLGLGLGVRYSPLVRQSDALLSVTLDNPDDASTGWSTKGLSTPGNKVLLPFSATLCCLVWTGLKSQIDVAVKSLSWGSLWKILNAQ